MKDLSFTIAAGHRQRIYSRVRVVLRVASRGHLVEQLVFFVDSFKQETSVYIA
jgi:hypothetical protein